MHVRRGDADLKAKVAHAQLIVHQRELCAAIVIEDERGVAPVHAEHAKLPQSPRRAEKSQHISIVSRSGTRKSSGLLECSRTRTWLRLSYAAHRCASAPASTWGLACRRKSRKRYSSLRR